MSAAAVRAESDTRTRRLAMVDQMWIDAGYFCREPRQLKEFFESYRSGDEYEREAIIHVMACSALCPGYLLRDYPSARPLHQGVTRHSPI